MEEKVKRGRESINKAVGDCSGLTRWLEAEAIIVEVEERER